MTTELDNWMAQLRTIEGWCKRRFLTPGAVQGRLRALLADPSSPIRSLALSFLRSPPFRNVEVTIGDLDGDSERTLSEPLDKFGTRCQISFNRRPDIVPWPTRLVGTLASLASAIWKGDYRDEKTQLLSLQIPGSTELLEETLRSPAQPQHELQALFFADLDKFKSINDEKGEQEGDRVIKELAAILQRHEAKDTLPLHRSGDEFLVLQSCDTPDDAVFLAYDIMRAVTEYDFNVRPCVTALSIGVAFARTPYESGLAALETGAERALKPGGQKQRGLARFAPPSNGPAAPMPSDGREDLLCVLVKSSVDSPSPFATVWLNFISRKVQAVVTGDIATISLDHELQALLAWVRPQWDPASPATAVFGSIVTEPRLSPADVLTAAAHGLLRAAYEGRIRWTEGDLYLLADDNGCKLQLQPTSQTLAFLDTALAPQASGLQIAFGGPIIAATGASPRRIILLQVGHGQRPIPDVVCADVIIIDDRPSRGGGLPDFWEAAAARVMSRLAEDPNIALVALFGETRHASRLDAELRKLSLGQADVAHLAYKTGVETNAIRRAAERLHGKYLATSDRLSLLTALASLLRPAHSLGAPASAETDLPRRLRRDLNTSDMSFGLEAGCRVTTIAEAYPAVLEIVRKAPGDTLRDQARAELHELVDFRLELLSPLVDRVPAFYASERASLENYFDREFVKPGGLFAAKLLQHGQLDAVLDHIADAVADPARPVATRRGILVIPHEITNPADIAPLGLVCIQIVPRFPPGRVRLSFSFTWRTVEALVGFPYSLYGSARYGEHLTEEIARRVAQRRAGRTIELGEIWYIAHSLHHFVDDFGSRIARRIVNEASD